jgi:NAD(P)-dependent dehydrogenase (short-subunit alcohol dehydrogenase family)
VRVNCVAPGVIDGATVRHHIADTSLRTEFVASQAAVNPIRRMPTDADVAEAALFLASDASDFITGSVLTVDGGWTSSMVRATER